MCVCVCVCVYVCLCVLSGVCTPCTCDSPQTCIGIALPSEGVAQHYTTDYSGVHPSIQRPPNHGRTTSVTAPCARPQGGTRNHTAKTGTRCTGMVPAGRSLVLAGRSEVMMGSMCSTRVFHQSSSQPLNSWCWRIQAHPLPGINRRDPTVPLPRIESSEAVKVH